MALTKTIRIDGIDTTFRASAAIPRIYRIKFGRDIYGNTAQNKMCKEPANVVK